MDLSEIFTTHSCHYAALWTWFKSSCASLTGFPGRKNSKFRHSATVCEPPRSQKNSFTIFSHFLAHSVRARDPNLKKSRSSHGWWDRAPPRDPGICHNSTSGCSLKDFHRLKSILNFFRFMACYKVVPSIQHPVLGPPQQAISTALQTKSRIPSKIGKNYHSSSTSA